jgi:hypothetical protein
VDFRTDRVGLLLDQFDTSAEMAKDRLAGMTDEEYLWEPAPGSLSIRRAGESPHATLGHGDWLLEWPRPEPEPAPLRTMAWLLGHLYDGFLGRYEWTFGARQADPLTAADFTPSARAALERFWALLERWRDGIAGLTDEQLDMIGYGQFPHGLDPQVPFIAIVWWTNRELIHHTAEIAFLRDLYLAR